MWYNRGVKQLPSPPPAICGAPAAFLSVCCRLRRQLFHDKAGDIVCCAALSVLAPLALAATLLAIPADEARAHNSNVEWYSLANRARAGDLNTVSHLLSEHMAELDLNVVVNHGAALHHAAKRGNEVMVSLLIAAGADVDVKGSSLASTNTPLHWAVQGSGYGKPRSAWVAVVSLLIAADADVDATDKHGRTPLNVGVPWRGFSENNHQAREDLLATRAMVSMLIAAGASVNTTATVVSRNGNAEIRSVTTPMLAASNLNQYKPRENLRDFWSSHRSALLAMLIAAGGHWGEACASPSVVNPAGSSPPCICESPNVGGPEDCAAPGAESCGGLTPAKFYDSGAGECVAFAECRAGATLNRAANLCECAGPAVLDAAGTGCLCESPNVGTPGACAAPGAESCGGLTPAKFYDSAAGECVAFAECALPSVLDAGANLCDCPAPNVGTDGAAAPGYCAAPGAESCGGLTPAKFYDSAAGECVAFAECAAPAVLDAGANRCDCPPPNVGTDGAAAPGYCAAPGVESCGGLAPAKFYDSTAGECVAFADCQASATLNRAANLCECPAGAFAHGDPSTAACHAGHAPIPHELGGWLDAIHDNNPNLVAHFISGHQQNPDGSDSLHAAARGGRHQAAKALIEGGADIGRKDGGGDAPLHVAVENGRAPLITLLLQRGAPPDAADADGNTALHLATRRTDTAENAELISFLLDKGATPNPRNGDGWRPLDLAFHGGNPGGSIWQTRRKMMAALIAGGADWSDECAGGAIPNALYEGAAEVATKPRCGCPPHVSQRDSFGACKCPGHSHAQVNGRCLPKGSDEAADEVEAMRKDLLDLRAALASLNARISAAAEMPREMVEEIAERAADAAREIKRRRDNFLALDRADLAGAPPPPVAMSDTAAECRMLGGEVQIHSATGIRVCSGIDANDTFCLVDSDSAYPCRGLFRHVRRCNDDYNRRALNPFFCGAQCGERAARGDECE